MSGRGGRGPGRDEAPSRSPVPEVQGHYHGRRRGRNAKPKE
eukprot:CAMPEP_0178723824 /NCGR_PEP_ID=MMETSP0699-20121125/25765_1 /TAXON_ID=265572 /ORGANISM="Extubocellulus spinifer, Strain CCMP396" /LENGTH=40 /DNA_ID= /DNA_START= /DNA_END= /DNA_ORIENTATION=